MLCLEEKVGNHQNSILTVKYCGGSIMMWGYKRKAKRIFKNKKTAVFSTGRTI